MNRNLVTIFLILSTGILMGCTADPSAPESLDNPASEGSKYPYLFASGNTLYMSWITTTGNVSTLKYARYSDKNWSNPYTIARDSSWFVNWADFPSIIADTNGPIAAHWLKKITGGPYAYNVNISITDSTGQWTSTLTPHRDSTATEHGFVSMIPWDESTILAVWLDGRRTAGRSDEDYYNIDKAMTLRGALISRSGKLQDTFLIDQSVCDCCQTSLAKTPRGAIIAYRNRTDDEIRDIYTSHFDGKQWSQPKAVHSDGWKIGACPVNGPALAVADTTVLLAWHTAADDNPTVKAAISNDQGQHFSSPKILNRKQSLGRVDAVLYNGRSYVSWMKNSSEKEALLQLSTFRAGDTTTTTKIIARMNNARQTGFPQMEIVEDELIFGWTAVDSVSSRIKTKKISVDHLNRR